MKPRPLTKAARTQAVKTPHGIIRSTMTDNAVPTLALTFAYWLHMLATVVWIGGLAALSILVIPAARVTLEAAAYSNLLARIQVRLQQLGWFSLAVLGVTGMFQMSAHPAYHGFLAIDSQWGVAILSKHLVIGGMVAASAYLTWGVLPALKRAALLRAAGKNVSEAQLAQMRRREDLLLRFNLALSVIVLALTAWARAAG
jgi:uncharacterized membrane protein